MELKIPPLLVAVLFACVMSAVAFATPSLSFDAAWLVWIGCASIAAGIGVAVAGVLAFRSASTTVDPTRPQAATSLVRGGIYRWTRNPMYLGFFLALLGFAFVLSNWMSIAVSIAFVPYITRFQIVPEERVLSNLFGSEFDGFRRDVRRWV